MKMLPTDAIGMLNVPDEIDTRQEHCPARGIKILDPKCDYRAW